MAIKPYANGMKYVGLSTDEKPVNAEVGTSLFETDTKDEYIYDGDGWVLKNQKTYQWLNEEITAGSFFSGDIPASGFDLATAMVVATGNVQISFRVALPNGFDYAWDPLGTMNGASMKTSCQAEVRGIESIKVIVSNNTEESVTAGIYVYLGKRGS